MSDSIVDNTLKQSVDATPAMPMITVAICSFNGAGKIGAALAALGAQTGEVSFEVVVVDDGSTDDTADVAERAGATVVRLDENRGRGFALQEAIKAARGAILAMTDDDCLPLPNWIESLAEEWARAPESVTVIGGSVRPLATDTFNRRYVDFRKPLCAQELGGNGDTGLVPRLRRALFPPPARTGRRPVLSTAGANMSLRLSAVREAGGFDPAIHFGGEEETLCRHLREAFGPDTVLFVPEIEMIHNFRPNLGDSLRRSHAYGRSHGQRWRREGGIPTVQPIPFLIAGIALALLAWRPKLGALVAAFLPALLYRGWLDRCKASTSLEPVLYPYVRLLEDVAGEAGFLAGLRDEQAVLDRGPARLTSTS
jgi:glycosyltransferase involved in cell wall biosynthesis